MKLSTMIKSTLLATMMINGTAIASEEKVPFEINLHGIQTGHAPLYISVQDAGKFRTNSGNAGTILRMQENSTQTISLSVEPGVYAVSIWHDLDEDGKFSMGENYIPLDGWGSSGTPPADRAPSFDEMAVEIYQSGQVIDIAMQYMPDSKSH